MRYAYDLILISSLFLQSNIALAIVTCEHTIDSFRCVTFVSNYDGDTFTVDIPNVHPFFGKNIAIRMAGIDTAELTSKNSCERSMARIAKARTREILQKANRIDLLDVKKDKYFRVLATVIVNTNINVNGLLLNENLAYPYDGETKPSRDWCKKLTK